MRKSGFYWVKTPPCWRLDCKWVVAEWTYDPESEISSGFWEYGHDFLNDSDFLEIGQKIEPPEEKQNA